MVTLSENMSSDESSRKAVPQNPLRHNCLGLFLIDFQEVYSMILKIRGIGDLL